MVDETIKQRVELMFQARDFESMWFAITDEYRDLGFTDSIADQDRIDEYTWITQQLRKYMFSKQDEILGCESLGDMIALIDVYIGKAGEYGEDRKKVVYNFMRDHWLYEIRNHLVNLIIEISMQDENDDGEEDEYV